MGTAACAHRYCSALLSVAALAFIVAAAAARDVPTSGSGGAATVDLLPSGTTATTGIVKREVHKVKVVPIHNNDDGGNPPGFINFNHPITKADVKPAVGETILPHLPYSHRRSYPPAPGEAPSGENPVHNGRSPPPYNGNAVETGTDRVGRVLLRDCSAPPAPAGNTLIHERAPPSHNG